MPKRSGKKQDLNEKAFSIVQQLTGQIPKPNPDAGKNPAAVELGRLGGLKGGRARADQLSAKRLSEIGRAAGRPRYPKGEARTDIVRARVTRSETARFLKAAKRAKLSVSDWVRKTCL